MQKLYAVTLGLLPCGVGTLDGGLDAVVYGKCLDKRRFTLEGYVPLPQRVGRKLDKCIALVAVLLGGHVERAVHKSVDAVGAVAAEGVIVAAQMHGRAVTQEHVGIILPVVYILREGIVVDRDHTLAFITHKERVEPRQILMFDMPVPHLHVGAAVYAGEERAAHLEGEAVAAPERIECAAGALRPVVLVVAGDDVCGELYKVEYRLYASQLLVAALVRKVSGDDDRIGIGGVDLAHGTPQTIFRRGVGRDVQVAQEKYPYGMVFFGRGGFGGHGGRGGKCCGGGKRKQQG